MLNECEHGLKDALISARFHRRNQAADVTQPVGLVVSIPPLLRAVVISAINTNINELRWRGRVKEKTNG